MNKPCAIFLLFFSLNVAAMDMCVDDGSGGTVCFPLVEDGSQVCNADNTSCASFFSAALAGFGVGAGGPTAGLNFCSSGAGGSCSPLDAYPPVDLCQSGTCRPLGPTLGAGYPLVAPPPSGPSFASFGIDWSTVVTGILAVGAVGLLAIIAMLGVRMIYRAVRGTGPGARSVGRDHAH
jgi:hypothetical protein